MSQLAKGGLHHIYKYLKEYCEFVVCRVRMRMEKVDVSLRHPTLCVNIIQEICTRNPLFENVPA
jgi:hypothetical protein